jgi:hypothetical protein
MNALPTTPIAKLLSPWERLGEGSWLRAKIAIKANLSGLGF